MFFFSCSVWLSRCKIVYYTFFSCLYGIAGSCADLAMVNSSWTKSHIENLWRVPDCIKRIYPPCDTSGIQVCNLLFIVLETLLYYLVHVLLISFGWVDSFPILLVTLWHWSLLWSVSSMFPPGVVCVSLPNV